MCGIAYVKRKDKKPAAKSVLKRYRAQKHRGTDGFGYAAIKDNVLVAYERATTEAEIIEKLLKEDAEEILFHHRFPTSTPNIEESAHPILTQHTSLKFRYLGVHNGVITNSEDLYNEHLKLGIPYTTEIQKGFITKKGEQVFDEYDWNDSEGILIETALALEGIKTEIDSIGSAAVITLRLEGDRVVGRYAYRNTRNPLMYKNDSTMTTLTSEGAGSPLEATFLHVLSEDGVLYEHPAKILPPWGYYTAPPAESNWAKNSTVGSHTGIGYQYTDIPMPHGTRPFRETLTAREREQLATEEEYDLSEEDFGDDYQSAGKLLTDPDYSQWFSVLKEETLWSEYEKCVGSKGAALARIRQIDERVENSDDVSHEVHDDRLYMADTVERLEKMEKAFETEIQLRESAKSAMAIPGSDASNLALAVQAANQIFF